MKEARKLGNKSLALLMSFLLVFSLAMPAVGAVESIDGEIQAFEETYVEEENELKTESERQEVEDEQDYLSESSTPDQELDENTNVEIEEAIDSETQYADRSEEIRNKIEQAIGKSKQYYKDLQPKGNVSHSDYWLFSALWGADENLKEFPWAENGMPWENDTFWTKGKESATSTSNEDAGIIIGSILLGQDPQKFGQRNIIQDLVDKQKENGAFFTIWGESWAMIALDLVDAPYDREKHIEHILGQQFDSGLFGGIDSNGWILMALAPYMDERQDVKKAIDSAVRAVHEGYQKKGEISDGWGANSNSVAAALMGLAAVGEDLFSDKWTKDGKNVVEQFIETYQQADGSFWWQENSAGAVSMATEQSLLALSTVIKGESIFVQLKKHKDENLDVKTNVSIRVEGVKETLLSEKNFEVKTLEKTATAFDATEQSLNRLGIPFEDSSAFISKIADEGTAIFGGWDGWQYVVNDNYPDVGAGDYLVKDGDEIVWFYGNVGDVYKGEASADEVEKLTLKPTIAMDSELYAGNEIEVAVTAEYNIYDEEFELEQESVRAKIKDADVHFNGGIYKTDENGIARIPGEKAKVGSYEIKVTKDIENSYPRLLRQAKKVIISEKESEEGGGGGGGTLPSTKTVTLSVEKRTIGAGDIIKSTEVPLKDGDTAFSLLKRTADERRISIDYSGSGAGLYVQGIDGLKEFNHGPLSGWMYSVNDSFPSISAGSYVLKDGDELRWQYTKNLGNDVGDDSNGGSGGGGGGGPAPTPTPDATHTVSDSEDEEISISADEKELYIQTKNGSKEVTNIVTLQFPKNRLPKIEAVRGHTILEITQDTEVKSEWDKKLQLPRNLAVNEKGLAEKVNAKLVDQKVSSIDHRIKVGGDKGIQFNKHVTLTLKGHGDKHAGFIDHDGNFETIKKYNSTSAQEDDVYAFKNGNDLTIKTKHFTEFLVYQIVGEETSEPTVMQPLIDSAAKWVDKNRDFSTYDEFNDWDVLALARAGKEVPALYYGIIEKHVKENNGEFRLVTDYERMALTATALGKDARNIAGYDFIEKIYNNSRMTNQGTNGALFALLALDAQEAEVPANAIWTRERLLTWLLDQQNDDGGFPLSKEAGSASDVDITAMALQALAKYQDRKDVKEVTEKALLWISEQQLANGGFIVWDEENSESVSQVIIGLTSLGISLEDERFVKKDGDLLTALHAFINKDGGLAHTRGEASNYMATQQGLLALAGNDRLLKKKKSVYDMTDVKPVEVPEEEIAFSDLDKKHFAYKEIMEMVDAGIISGYRDGTFRPDDKLIRGQAAILFARALDLESPAKPHGFKDIPLSSTFYDAAHATKAAGVFAGKKDGTFGAQDELTREQMASVLVRAFNLKETGEKVPLKDLDKVSKAHRKDVEILYQNGITAGRSNGTFDPRSSVSRAQFSAFLYRALEK